MAFDTLVDKAKLENSITVTADAIRAKTGTTDKIKWDIDKGFSEVISGLVSEQMNKPGVIPKDIKTAAMEIVRKVNEVRKSDSIVFMAMADSHHTGEQSDTGWQTLTNLGNLHAGMAAKVLSYALDLDFVCHLGDITFGHGTTTSALLHQQIGEMNSWLDEAWDGIPRFQTVGNHDTGYYAYSNSGIPLESNEYLFSVFGKYCEGAVYGSETYGYCYRDFDSKKLRVICLNTSEGDSLNASYECSPAQLLWFAQTLKSVGAKSGWGVIVLGHYPLDYVGMHDATAVVKAYVEGSSITINGTTVNFSGSNNAKFIANFHGHTHCFKVARLNSLDTSTKKATEYDAWRIGIPNSGFYRNNHQEGPNAYGLYFEEETTYDKVNDGVNDTAFVVNVITPSEEVVHSFCYGAGYDRAIGYANVNWYTATFNLTKCSIDTPATNIAEGNEFSATITTDEHCAVSSITVTMGGVDITASAYSDGVVHIPSVTGNIVITAVANIALACINQIPISTDASGNIYNGKGYREKYYMSTSSESVNRATDLTGFIPCKVGDVIRLKDTPFNATVESCRLTFFTADKTYIAQVVIAATYILGTQLKGVQDSSGNYIQFTIDSQTAPNCGYVRISAADITENSIVTVNEEIKYADEVGKTYGIVYNLTNVVSSSNSAVVVENEAYTAELTAKTGYVLDEVTIFMGGADVTTSVYSNGNINIQAVTGDIVITANAVSGAIVSYTNQLPISTDASGNVYNGKGFKENTYLSSGNDGTKSGIYATGFIPVVWNAYNNAVFYCKNVGMQTGQDSHRISVYDADKKHLTTVKTTVTSGWWTWGTDGNIDKITVLGKMYPTAAFIRICCGYLGADSIITSNEPIE